MDTILVLYIDHFSKVTILLPYKKYVIGEDNVK